MKPLPDDSAPLLVFDWRPLQRRWPGLIKWLLLTILAMAGFFYLFKVNYPQSQRLTPVPVQITIISASEPATRALLHRVQDQDFAIIPGTGGDVPAVRLEDHAPLFHPSFEKREIRLEDLPHKTYTVPPPRLLDFTAPVLPALDFSDLKPPRAMPSDSAHVSPVLAVEFTGSLAARKLLHPPDFTDLSLTDPESWRFHVGVEASGRISIAMPTAVGEQSKLLPLILEKLNGARFKPAPGAKESIEWSSASLRWANSSKP